MIAHILIRVKDFTKSEKFYRQVLGTLGLNKNIGEENVWCGWSEKEEPLFEISQADQDNPTHTKVHIAFQAKSKLEVEEFYRVAILNGGSDNGKPGVREEYAKNYYACFVKDLDDNNIECVYFKESQNCKNFDDWNSQKKEIDLKAQRQVEDEAFFHERDIVWVRCGQNVGVESNGKGEYYMRPALIIRKLNKHHFIVLFCTTTDKVHPYYFKIESDHPELIDTKVVLTQIKTIDKYRIALRLVTLGDKDFNKIKNECLKLVFNNLPLSFDNGEANAHK